MTATCERRMRAEWETPRLATVRISNGDVKTYRVEIVEETWAFWHRQRGPGKYLVRLGRGNRVLACNCPAGQYGKACKHKDATKILLS